MVTTDRNGPATESETSAERLVGALTSLRQELHAKGLGHRVGFGARPTLLIVDMQLGFTDPVSPLGADAPDTVAAVAELLEVARQTSIPVLYTVCLAAPEPAVWQRKLPANAVLSPSSKWVQVDPRLAPADGDAVLRKHLASAFFGTDLDDRLRALGTDTLVVTGMTTSGCVRATAVDACSLGYRVVVPTEAVADRLETSHFVSLFDMDLKYADVMSLEEVTARLTVADGHQSLRAPGS